MINQIAAVGAVFHVKIVVSTEIWLHLLKKNICTGCTYDVSVEPAPAASSHCCGRNVLSEGKPGSAPESLMSKDRGNKKKQQK